MITSSGTAHISRTPSFIDYTQDWTRSQYVKFPSASTGTDYYTVWFDDNIAATDFIELYATLVSAVFSLTIDISIGGVLHSEVLSNTIATATNVYTTIRYTASTHLLEMLINGVVVDSATLSLATLPTAFDNDFMLNDGSALGGNSIGYDFLAQRVLMDSEIISQMGSITITNATGLVSYCPLQTSIDLTDHLGTFLAVFFPSGTITTNTTDPLLSIVAGPPTNTTPATATVITADSAYFQDTLSSGSAAAETWYKRTCIEDRVWGAQAFGGLTTFKPTINVYQGLADANSLTNYLDIFGDQNKPIQFPAVAGNDYYFQSTRNGAVSPATVQISILDALNLTVPIGSIAVNSEIVGFPLALLDRNTGYPIHFINPFACGEGGNPLANGTTLVVDIASNNLKLYNADLITAGTVALSPVSLNTHLSSNETSTFLVGLSTGSNSPFRLVAEDGTINPTVFTTSSALFRAVGLDVNATVAYYSDGGTSTAQPVKAWDLVNNVAMANLVTGVTDYVIDKDIIVLQDGTILVPRNKNTVTRNFTILRYNSSGTTLDTYDLGDNSNNDNRIATDFTTTSFWAWIKGRAATSNDGFNIFKQVKLSDGSILISTPQQPQYDSGTYTPSTIINTPIRFGAAESCPFWITRVEIGPMVNNRSGIYFLTGTGSGNPTQRHDTLWIDASIGTTEDVKIP